VNAAYLNGHPASADDLRALALCNYGHFTSMQVRGGAVQGLALHYQRLQTATAELFDAPLDLAQLVGWLRLAVNAHPDCSLRVSVFARGFQHRHPERWVAPDVLVSTGPASLSDPSPLRVKSYPFQRPVPHLKHLGTFPLFHYRRLARRAGYDDALFVGPAGEVSEGTVWNIGFWAEDRVIWPNAPALAGTAVGLLVQGLDVLGVAHASAALCLEGLGEVEGAFACNASGLWPVASIDDRALPASVGAMPILLQALQVVAWQPA